MKKMKRSFFFFSFHVHITRRQLINDGNKRSTRERYPKKSKEASKQTSNNEYKLMIDCSMTISPATNDLIKNNDNYKIK